MRKVLILANNLSPTIAKETSARIEDWLKDDSRVLVLPSGLDLYVPVSMEAILLDVDFAGHIRDAVRLGIPCE